VYERAKTVMVKSPGLEFQCFVVQAIEEKVRRLTEAEIDEAFAQNGARCRLPAQLGTLAREFASSDWEAFDPQPPHEQPKKPRFQNPFAVTFSAPAWILPRTASRLGPAQSP